MQRITGNVDEEIFSDRTKNGPFGVELRQIAVGLQFRHPKGFPSFS